MAHTIEHVQQSSTPRPLPLPNGGAAASTATAGGSAAAAVGGGVITTAIGSGGSGSGGGLDMSEEKADLIFKRFVEADVLIGSFPAHISSESEQLTELQRLQTLNEAAQKRLDSAHHQAGMCLCMFCVSVL